MACYPLLLYGLVWDVGQQSLKMLNGRLDLSFTDSVIFDFQSGNPMIEHSGPWFISRPDNLHLGASYNLSKRYDRLLCTIKKKKHCMSERRI